MAETESPAVSLQPARQVLYCGGMYLNIALTDILTDRPLVCSLPPEVGRRYPSRNLSFAPCHFAIPMAPFSRGTCTYMALP